jgi:protoporphyrin/coproporphyrin ferrochelatase
MSRRGVILVNLGTPETATAQGVRHFLQEFLSDRRVVDLPRWLWWPLLHGVILPLRSRRVAKAYAQIWQAEGSPLLVISRQQQAAVQSALQTMGHGEPVELAMSYGEPSLQTAWQNLRAQGVDEVLLLPLYPQYSSTTTAPIFDGWARVMAQEQRIPALQFLDDYHDHPLYISALSHSIRQYWQQHGQGHLLFSFHGIPQRYAERGDPYPQQCQSTARLVAEQLGLESAEWGVAFQSRFGREPWLQPYTDEVLRQLPKSGLRRVDIICPAFAADCLETLEEIAVEGKHLFIQAGGEQYHYIPALNAEPAHVHLLTQLIAQRFA